jgi:hypothetical protein
MATAAENDQMLRETRWLAAFIVPFLVVAFYILYFRTSETAELFAWGIGAPMTAMMLGSAYIGSVYFFARAFTAPRWHHVGVGFLPVTTFASFMCVATLLHWDKFNHGHISFYAWAALYFTTPFLVVVAWLRNRGTDNGAVEKRDFRFTQPIRYIIGGIGVFYIIVAILLFLQPTFMIGIWPWTLTPLTARVVGGLLALLGAFGVMVALDGRWSSCRIALQSLLVTMVLGLIAVIRSWDTFDTSRWFTWVFVGTLAFILIATPIFYWYVENKLKQSAS